MSQYSYSTIRFGLPVWSQNDQSSGFQNKRAGDIIDSSLEVLQALISYSPTYPGAVITEGIFSATFSSGNSSLAVPALKAIVRGTFIESVVQQSIASMTNSNTYFIFANLTESDPITSTSRANRNWNLSLSTSGTTPTSGMLIGKVITTGSSATVYYTPTQLPSVNAGCDTQKAYYFGAIDTAATINAGGASEYLSVLGGTVYGQLFVPSSSVATANFAKFSLGGGNFNGTGSSFTGSASGTDIGINALATSSGNFLDFQVQGTSKVSIGKLGKVGIGAAQTTAQVVIQQATGTVSDKTLYLKAASGQTGNNLQVDDSGGQTLLAIIPSTSQPTVGIAQVSPTITLIGSSASNIHGLDASPTINLAGFNATSTTVAALNGSYTLSSSGTATGIAGAQLIVQNTSTGTITNAYGLRVLSAVNSGGGVVTNAYGIKIDAQTVAAASGSNFGIFCSSGSLVGNSSGNGFSVGNYITISAITGGGSSQVAASVSGGNGSAFSWIGGNGGLATAATGTGTSGVGGTFTATSGNGGAQALTTANNISGAGGGFNLSSGTGGVATTSTTGTNTAGGGGALSLAAGNGGNASSGTTNTAGNGGSVSITGGKAGTGDSPGTAGSVTITAGPAASQAAAVAGSVVIIGGPASSTGTGGTGGNVNLAGSSANGDGTTARNGGSATITSGSGVAGTSPGNGGGLLTTYGTGGNQTSTSGGTAGNGATWTISAGTGGTASAGTSGTNTGGTGGRVNWILPAGGAAASITSSNNTGGTGGGFSVTTGAGGATTGNTTGNNSAGGAGTIVLSTGVGGDSNNANATPGTITGGNSGTVTISSGTGGNTATGATATAGNAGLVSVTGGNGGASTVTAGNGTGGNGAGVTITCGTGGASSGATAGTNTGGTGGTLTLKSGIAGTATNGGVNTNGTPGTIVLQTSSGTGAVATRLTVQAAGQITLAAITAPGSPNAGDIWNDSTQKAFAAYPDGIQTFLDSTLVTTSSVVTVGNTTTETSLVGTVVGGSATLPANFFVVGKTVRVTAFGYYSGVNTNTLRIKVKLGSTVIGDTTAEAFGATTTNQYWRLEFLMTCFSTGVSGTIWGQGEFKHMETAGLIGNSTLWEMPNSATVTLNTTTSQVLDISAQFGTAVVGNTITSTNVLVQRCN